MSALLLFATALLGWLPVGDSVDAVLARRAAAQARVAIAIVDAETGELLYARRVDEPMVPASNMKVLTTAAAVSLLGPDFEFSTQLLGSARPDAQGVLAGDLVLWGSGDPCLRRDTLQEGGIDDPAALMAELLAQAGVRHVEGSLVIDDSFLDREWVHPDWDLEDLDFPYAAPVSALSIHGNCLRVSVDGRVNGPEPRVAFHTATSGYHLRNDLSWVSTPGTNVVGALRPDDGGIVRVRGRMSHGLQEQTLDVPVRDAPLLFGRCLRTRLERRGITLTGGLERDAGAARALVQPVELVRVQTSLALALMLANKESDNSVSDHLFKVLGAVVEDDGSFLGGGRALERFLDETVGTARRGLVLQDGSGLAGSNRITARAMVDTLVAMNRAEAPARSLFLRTLPVSGLDGTLRDRLTDPPYRGAVRAKTGYILGVSALSGYVQTQAGNLLAFSILINDVPKGFRNKDMKAIQDDICRDLVDRW